MGFTACQKEIQESLPVNGDTVQVTFVAGTPDTKTSVDTSDDETPLFSWDESETFAVLEQKNSSTPTKAGSVEYEKVDGKAKITATFGAGSYVKGATIYQYVTIYPASGYVGAESLAAATLSLPAEQTMATGSYDPAADLMVSTILKNPEPPTGAQMVSFTRMAAVVKMTLKNFTLESGDEVEQVIFTAEGKKLAGTVTANLADPHKFTVAEGVDNVTVNTTSSTDVYFTVLPTTLEAGDAYTVTVITNKKLYIKKGTIGEGKTLDFKKGMVTLLGVNMEGVSASEKWVLVKDASTLKEGDVVTIAAKNYNYAVGKQANNYPIASQTEVIKFGDYLYHPVATAETSVDNRIQHYTLLQRDNSRVAFDFYNGVDYEGDTSIGFVFASGSNYSPKLQSWCDNNTLFDVEITDGVSTLKASEITATYKWWRYYHSTNASSRKFDCTSSVPTGNNQICLYKLEGAVGTIPTIAANVIVPDSDESVVIAEEGAAGATAISTEQVTFNYVGPWTISAEADAEWLDVAYDATNNYLTYTAEANTGAKRETTVTITASLEGQESLTWSFKVIQKGVPQDISLADFVKLSKDENSTYRITGRITEMTTSNSGTFKLTDGNDNVATVMYLYTDGGVKVSGNNEIGVAVGDVMTVTTVPVGSGKGGNNSHYSIYKGHYGLKTTAGLAADYTGGTVEVSVETYSNGNIEIPEAVEATMAENDFAELAYSDGKAIVTFATENTTADAREAELTFTYGMTSVVVIVQQGVNPANKIGYELVTDASTLAVGDEVIIVTLNAEKALATPTKTSDTKLPSTDIEKIGNVIYDVEKTGAQTFILKSGATEGTMAFEFTYKDTVYYPYYSSGLKMRTSVNATASWTISIKEGGNASISTVSSSNDYHLKFNSATSVFTAYLSTTNNATKAENAVCIYKKQTK